MTLQHTQHAKLACKGCCYWPGPLEFKSISVALCQLRRVCQHSRVHNAFRLFDKRRFSTSDLELGPQTQFGVKSQSEAKIFYLCIRVHMHAYVYVCACMCVEPKFGTYSDWGFWDFLLLINILHINRCMCTCKYMYTCMSVYMYAYTFIYARVCVYICTRVGTFCLFVLSNLATTRACITGVS